MCVCVCIFIFREKLSFSLLHCWAEFLLERLAFPSLAFKHKKKKRHGEVRSWLKGWHFPFLAFKHQNNMVKLDLDTWAWCMIHDFTNLHDAWCAWLMSGTWEHGFDMEYPENVHVHDPSLIYFLVRIISWWRKCTVLAWLCHTIPDLVFCVLCMWITGLSESK